MTLLIFFLATLGSVAAVFNGDFKGAIGIWIGAGMMLFVWQAVCDGAKAVKNAIPPSGDQYNLTQNRYDLTESDDPTRPNENIPAIIEIGKHYREKGQP